MEKYLVWFALVSGALLPLAFSPFGIFPLAFLCPAVLFCLLDQTESPGRGFRLGFSFGFAGFLGGLYWLYISLHTFGNAPLYIAVPLMLATVGIMALYWGALGWVTVKWFRHATVATRYLVLLPAGWLILDWLRGWVATGFPWLSLGYSQTDTVLGGFAPVVGVFGITYLAVLLAGAVVFAIRRPRSAWISITIVVAVMGGGALLKNIDWAVPKGKPIRASLIQGSIPQDKKWLREQFNPTLDLYHDLTAKNWASDLIIWPEAAIPAIYSNVGEYLEAIHREAKANETAILLGIPRHDNGKFFNSVVALGPQGVHIYDKRHLVPFGEYFPVPQFVRNWMRLRNLPYSDYQSGGMDQKPIQIDGQSVALTICYEDVFGEEQLSYLPTATLLVNVSNDAWFGDSIAPHQHLQIARMRAMEAERFLLRSTNTGISALIDQKGRVLAVSPQFKTHVLTGSAQGFEGFTPYARWGNWFVVLWAGGLIVVGILFGARGSQH